jgi:hypothetical protein
MTNTPIPAETTAVRLSDPLPCGIATGPGPADTCGRPAYAAYVWSEPGRDIPGLLVILPVCKACAMRQAENYTLDWSDEL